MRLILHLFICIALFCGNSFAQKNFTLEGKILNKETNMPVLNATIKIGATIAFSDEQGFFKIYFKSLKQQIEIFHISYNPTTAPIPENLKNEICYLQPTT